MASYALYLFAVADGALKMVLAVPMSSYTDIAGDWHKDGTRKHDITQSANILIVSKHSTNGHFDLRLKSRTGHWQRHYQWSPATAAYRLQMSGTRFLGFGKASRYSLLAMQINLDA